MGMVVTTFSGMTAPRTSAAAARLGAAALAVLLCASCGSSASGEDGASGRRISVVASTTVYGDLASTIGGSAVHVTSIISDPDQDPHSYEADAKTQLALRKADLVIENGGGYDDFVDSMLDSSKSDAPVLNAVQISGRSAPAGGELNEHVWYDLAAMGALVDRIVSELSDLDASAAAEFMSNGAQMSRQIALLREQAHAIAMQGAGAGVAVTEPVPLYLLEACGLVNKTPEAFSEAIEEGSDVSPRDLRDMLAVIEGGGVRILAYNEQTSGPETEHLIDAARRGGVALLPVRESVPEGEHYVAWMGGYLAQIEDALRR